MRGITHTHARRAPTHAPMTPNPQMTVTVVQTPSFRKKNHVWLSQCPKQMHAFPPMETDVARSQQADQQADNYIDFRRKATTMAVAQTCRTFECREVGATPSGWRSSRAAVTADGTSTSAICLYMDMGAMVDVPHACDQEAHASIKRARLHKGGAARMNPRIQDKEAHTGVGVERD